MARSSSHTFHENGAFNQKKKSHRHSYHSDTGKWDYRPSTGNEEVYDFSSGLYASESNLTGRSTQKDASKFVLFWYNGIYKITY